jgi:hypothetical protein
MLGCVSVNNTLSSGAVPGNGPAGTASFGSLPLKPEMVVGLAIPSLRKVDWRR